MYLPFYLFIYLTEDRTQRKKAALERYQKASNAIQQIKTYIRNNNNKMNQRVTYNNYFLRHLDVSF